MNIFKYSVFNLVQVTGQAERIAAFRSRCIRHAESTFLCRKWEKLVFDFNALVPVPPELNNVDFEEESFLAAYYAITGEEMKVRLWPNVSESEKQMIDSNRTEFIEKVEQAQPGITSRVNRAIEAKNKYGDSNSREWCVEHWSCFDVGLIDGELTQKGFNDFTFNFYSAFSIPVQIFDALATEYPELVFDFECHSLEFNSFYAEGKIANGTCSIREPDDPYDTLRRTFHDCVMHWFHLYLGASPLGYLEELAAIESSSDPIVALETAINVPVPEPIKAWLRKDNFRYDSLEACIGEMDLILKYHSEEALSDPQSQAIRIADLLE